MQWRRSTKGETAARRKSANPAPPWLSGRGVSRKLCREPNRGKPEQHPKQEPKIGIQQEIFIRLNTTKGGREKQKQSVPRNYEAQRKQERAFQLFDDLPSGDRNRQAHKEPEN